MAIKVDLKKLKALRQEARLTQAQLSKALGYKTALGYHYIETGRCRLRAEQLVILARVLGVEVESLIDTSVNDEQAAALDATGT